MLQNIVDFKAKSFLSERNTSTMAYEVKAVRAMWDPSLSIPGTNRRGGWRCPTGTRYGGQITDRFGRSCGWGVARRIANQISDIGQRLENVDDARRGRRIARRERRILARLNPQDARAGRLERGLRGVAERLEGGEAPTPRGGRRGAVTARTPSVDTPEAPRELTPAPRAPRRRRAPARRQPDGGNLRESEERRMEREIEQPGAPRTGEAPARRPQRGAPARQRRRNLLEVESDEVLQDMLNEMRQDPDYKDSDDYKQVMKEIRRRQRLNNRRRRAVVGEANKPKAPVRKPEAVVEPKIVKPRRPKPIVDVREPDAGSESPKPKTPKKPRSGEQNRLPARQIEREFEDRNLIMAEVLRFDRLEVLNDAGNFPGQDRPSVQNVVAQEALDKVKAAEAVLERLEDPAIPADGFINYSDADGAHTRTIREIRKDLRAYADAWQEILDENRLRTPESESTKPKAPAAPAIDPIDAPFIAPDKKDIRKVPEALKHQPPKVEPAKFKAEQEQIIEEALLEIRDAASLNKFSLLVDQAIFNENEGRQGALRNFQKELTKVAEILKRDPGANIDALIAEQKRQYMANFQMRGGVANARTKLNELEAQLRDKFIKLRTPPGNGAEEKERSRVSLMEDIANIKKSIGSYEGHLQLVDALEPEIRKASERIKQGFVFNPDATNIPKPTPADVKKKIKDQISAAIDRRQGKLAKYLEERYPNGGAQFQDMTPEKWRTLSPIQRNEYIKEAYSHPVIKGKNGKLYNAVASVNGGSVEVVFNEINAQGQIIRARIGTSSRSIRFVGGEVYQASMFISSKLDRGADIQTIYNQHAFLYLSKIGITKAKVNAADDGQYVWARVGFKRGSGLGRGDLRALEAPLKFYEDFGPGGLISNDAEYARIKSILTQAAGGAKFSHQDIIFALDDPTGDKPRMEYVKQWFKPNLGFPGGTLKFVDQKVGGTPPRRPRRARAPRVPANGGV